MSRYIGLFGVVSLIIALSVTGCGKDSIEKSSAIFEGDKNSKEAKNQLVESSTADSSVTDKLKAVETIVPKKVTEAFRVFSIYSDENAPDNHYFPSGWMGDFSDVSIGTAHLDNPHSGTTSMRIRYTNKASQGARWAGVYWQNPANNWGNRAGGYDLTGAKKLSFWVRGDKGGERIEEFKVGGINGEYSDTDIAGIGPIILSTEWKQYSINLEGKDLSSIIGGFAWSANLDFNPGGATFYLDDIRYE